MNKALFTFAICLFFALPSHAEISEEEVERARQVIKENLTEDVVEASKPLNKSIDYITTNYSERQLKDLIRNSELIERKSSLKNGHEYIPYDRKINVNNPAEVKRFIKKRSKIVF